jgi:hypothetical protein
MLTEDNPAMARWITAIGRAAEVVNRDLNPTATPVIAPSACRGQAWRASPGQLDAQ